MELFAETLRNGEYLIFAILLAISIVLNLSKFTDLIDSRRKRRIKELSEAINCKNISKDLIEHLKDEIDVEYFRLAHGIVVSKILLDALLIIKERIQGKVSFRHIIRVAKIIPDVEGVDSISYRVRLNYFEKLFCLFNLVFGFVFILFSIYLCLVTLSTISSFFNFGLMILGIMLFLMGLYMLGEGASIVSAHHVNKALEEYADQKKE